MDWLGAIVLLAVYVGVAYAFRNVRSKGTTQPDPSVEPAGMPPDEFRRDVLPLVVEAWTRRCFCDSTAFTRMVSTELGPNALADAQILIQDIIQELFLPEGRWTTQNGEQSRPFCCPQCGAKCLVLWEDFSINMSRSYVRWVSTPAPRGARTPYLIGFYGYSPPQHIEGFHRVRSPAEFVTELVGPTT
jgi:hypothetical protein